MHTFFAPSIVFNIKIHSNPGLFISIYETPYLPFQKLLPIVSPFLPTLLYFLPPPLPLSNYPSKSIIDLWATDLGVCKHVHSALHSSAMMF